jgi:ribosomal protein S19
MDTSIIKLLLSHTKHHCVTDISKAHKELAEFITSQILIPKYNGITIGVHNGGKFDFVLMVRALLENGFPYENVQIQKVAANHGRLTLKYETKLKSSSYFKNCQAKAAKLLEKAHTRIPIGDVFKDPFDLLNPTEQKNYQNWNNPIASQCSITFADTLPLFQGQALEKLLKEYGIAQLGLPKLSFDHSIVTPDNYKQLFADNTNYLLHDTAGLAALFFSQQLVVAKEFQLDFGSF